MMKVRPTEYPAHNWADHECPCVGCSGARKARDGVSTAKWYERPFAKPSGTRA